MRRRLARLSRAPAAAARRRPGRAESRRLQGLSQRRHARASFCTISRSAGRGTLVCCSLGAQGQRRLHEVAARQHPHKLAARVHDCGGGAAHGRGEGAWPRRSAKFAGGGQGADAALPQRPAPAAHALRQPSRRRPQPAARSPGSRWIFLVRRILQAGAAAKGWARRRVRGGGRPPRRLPQEGGRAPPQGPAAARAWAPAGGLRPARGAPRPRVRPARAAAPPAARRRLGRGVQGGTQPRHGMVTYT